MSSFDECLQTVGAGSSYIAFNKGVGSQLAVSFHCVFAITSSLEVGFKLINVDAAFLRSQNGRGGGWLLILLRNHG